MPNIRGQMARAEKTSDRVKPRRASAKPVEPGTPTVGRKEISPEVAKGSARIYGRYKGSQATKTEAEQNFSFAMLYTCDSVDTEFVRLQAIRQGLPVSFVDEIVQSGAITLGEVNELILPKKTLSHRRQAGTLTPGQSDKLARVARVVAKAEETFGNKEKARRWLRRPTAPLNNEEPLKLLDTEAGARLVEALLVRIEHGIAA